MPAPGGFTYSRAVREWAFVQVPLVSLSDFRKAAGERGLMKVSPFDASPWETLDREDLLPPVAYSLHGFWHHDEQGYLDNGDLIVREERGFVPWDELRSEAQRRNGADLYVLYGHWQLLSLATVVDHVSSSTPLLALGRGLDESARRASPMRARRLTASDWLRSPGATGRRSCCFSACRTCSCPQSGAGATAAGGSPG